MRPVTTVVITNAALAYNVIMSMVATPPSLIRNQDSTQQHSEPTWLATMGGLLRGSDGLPAASAFSGCLTERTKQRNWQLTDVTTCRAPDAGDYSVIVAMPTDMSTSAVAH